MSSEKSQTGGCYAARIGGCSEVLSREHAASDTVLKEIDQGGGVEVSGMSWLDPGTTRSLPPSALASRVLCVGHNSYLSKYDSVGGRAFSAIGAAIRMAHGAGATIPTEQVDSHVFGGWMLKMFCGLAASGQPTDRAGNRINVALEDEWIQVIFGQRPWPSRWTTTVLRGTSSTVYTQGGGVEIAPLHVGKRVGAVEVVLHGIRFVLFLAQVPPTLEGAQVIALPLLLAFTSLRNHATSYVDFAAQNQAGPPSIVEFRFTGVQQPG